MVVASSFADIFSTNCFKNGLLTVVLPENAVAQLMRRAQRHAPYSLTIDLESRTVFDEQGFSAAFPIDDFRRHCLLEGLDEIGLTLQREAEITAYEARHSQPPWARIAE
jgi:3-isopropylmalate/(R)-2-methylmalate dehydratase small subunit